MTSPALLHLQASPRGADSHSRHAGQLLVDALRERVPGLAVTTRDLGRAPPPHPDEAFVAASLMPAERRGPAQQAALALSEALIQELDAADAVVLATPMHNFTVPSTLKAWIDHVVRSRRTFGMAPDTGRKHGLLRDRPVRVLLACGSGLGQDTPGGQADFVTPYLRYVFQTIGIHDVEVLAMENLRRGAPGLAPDDARLQTLAAGLAGRL